MDPVTAAKLSILPGDASFGSQEPEELKEYIDVGLVESRDVFLQFYPSSAMAKLGEVCGRSSGTSDDL